MTDLNLAGESHAHSLIVAGKVDRTSPWSFDDATDGAKLLGKNGDDWAAYGQIHLGLDRSANEKTKGRYKYPFGKNGKVYRSGVIAIKQRAAAQNDGAIEKSSSALLAAIDKPSMSSIKVEGRRAPFEFKFVEGDGTAVGTFEGHGSVFNNQDDYGDVFRSGAFARTLSQAQSSGRMPKMLLNHGGLPWGGQTAESLLPVGTWDHLAEDSRGLAGKGRLINLDTESGKRLYGAMKERQIDGLSLTYIAREFTRGSKPSDPRRSITSADLIEMGPVTFPANDLARISEVKSLNRISTIRQFEDFLRDVGGFSNAAAKAIAASGFKANPPNPRDEDGIGDAIASQFKRLADKIRSSN